MQFPLLMPHPLTKSYPPALLHHDASEIASELTASCFLS
jgi:hypothetical protein